MRHSMKISLCVLSLGTAAVLSGPDTARANSSDLAECVAATAADVPEQIAYDVFNDCENHARCEMTWDTVCGDEGEGPTYHRRRVFFVPAGESQRVHLSVTPCDRESYSVENVAWECSPR